MRTACLLVLCLLVATPFAAAETLPSPTHHPCTPRDSRETCGVIPVGTGAPLLAKIDHHRYLIPDEAVGIVVLDARITPGPLPGVPATIHFGVLGCPPGMACVQGGPASMPCLSVYASAGATFTPYRFAWAFDEKHATILLRDMPQHARAPASSPFPGEPC